MNMSKRVKRSFAVSFIAAIAFGCVALLVGSGRFAVLDDAVIAFVQGFEQPTMTKGMAFFSAIGTGRPLMCIMLAAWAGLYALEYRRSELAMFAAALVGSSLLNKELKLAFHRARPLLHRIAEAHGYSFPSGHAMAAFSLYGLLAYLLWRRMNGRAAQSMLIACCAALVLAIGVSRIYLGVHYPSDVLGGYLASLCWLAAVVGGHRILQEVRHD